MQSSSCAFIPNILLLLVLGTAAEAAAQAPSAGNSDHGKVLFQQSCALCHATGLDAQPPVGQGPLLAGVMGRPAASLPNFGYTKALEASHLTWDSATLDRFLAAPATVVPGTNMVIAVPAPADRHDLIAFLATLRPVALPTKEESAAAAAHA